MACMNQTYEYMDNNKYNNELEATPVLDDEIYDATNKYISEFQKHFLNHQIDHEKAQEIHQILKHSVNIDQAHILNNDAEEKEASSRNSFCKGVGESDEEEDEYSACLDLNEFPKEVQASLVQTIKLENHSNSVDTSAVLTEIRDQLCDIDELLKHTHADNHKYIYEKYNRIIYELLALHNYEIHHNHDRDRNDSATYGCNNIFQPLGTVICNQSEHLHEYPKIPSKCDIKGLLCYIDQYCLRDGLRIQSSGFDDRNNRARHSDVHPNSNPVGNADTNHSLKVSNKTISGSRQDWNNNDDILQLIAIPTLNATKDSDSNTNTGTASDGRSEYYQLRILKKYYRKQRTRTTDTINTNIGAVHERMRRITAMDNDMLDLRGLELLYEEVENWIEIPCICDGHTAINGDSNNANKTQLNCKNHRYYYNTSTK